MPNVFVLTGNNAAIDPIVFQSGPALMRWFKKHKARIDGDKTIGVGPCVAQTDTDGLLQYTISPDDIPGELRKTTFHELNFGLKLEGEETFLPVKVRKCKAFI